MGTPRKETSEEAKKPEAEKPVQEKPPTPEELFALYLKELNTNADLVARSAQSHDQKFTLRALRRIGVLRRKLTKRLATDFIKAHVAESEHDELRAALEAALASAPDDGEEVPVVAVSGAMDVDADEGEAVAAAAAATAAADGKSSPSVEVTAFAALLVLVFVVDKCAADVALTLARALVKFVEAHVEQRRSLQPVAGKAYFYLARAAELEGSAAVERETRGVLLRALRAASLRHDDDGVLVALNALLRQHVLQRHYAQAYKLMTHVTFRADHVSANQHARFLYYEGRVRAMQLAYSDAHVCLQQALRKAPQGANAFGFRASTQKLLCVVQLLMGDVPERHVFRRGQMDTALRPYLQLTLAVRDGDVASFEAVRNEHAALFERDGVASLVRRLRHNVIKTALRKITAAYSRISLADIGQRLGVASDEDTEYIVSKAIRDRVIDAVIEHDERAVRSIEAADLYATYEPAAQFDERIQFCVKVHNDAVLAMQYPGKAVPPAEDAVEAVSEQELMEIAASLDDDEEEGV